MASLTRIHSTYYASMVMNGTQSADFIKVLHPTLRRANLSDVAITCCEATGWLSQVAMTTDVVAAGAEDLVGVFTGHTYTSPITRTQPTTRKVWETECSDLAKKWSTAWYTPGGHDGDGLRWAGHIHDGLTAGNVSAYLWWVGTQDRAASGGSHTNEKLIFVENDNYEVSKRFWAFAQYSRNIRPGAWRVEVSGGGADLRATAFVNKSGSVVVVVINNGDAAAPLSLAGVKAKSATAWLTNSNHDMDATPVTVEADGAVSGLSVPGRAMLSIVVTQA
jgi:O-glycosyl hydrolase